MHLHIQSKTISVPVFCPNSNSLAVIYEKHADAIITNSITAKIINVLVFPKAFMKGLHANVNTQPMQLLITATTVIVSMTAFG